MPTSSLSAVSLRPSAGPWLLLVLWLGSAALGFWLFELRHVRTFETDTARIFETEARRGSAEAWYRAHLQVAGELPAATVVHFFAPGCDCNRFTEPHLTRIKARYQPQQVRFVAVTRTPSSAALGMPTLTLPASGELDWLDSAPAALVFDRDGRLVYFGPYSSAAWCGTGGGLVEGILDRLLAGRRPELARFYGRGCFCSR
jgi:Domain of unknown function (DUF6436)